MVHGTPKVVCRFCKSKDFVKYGTRRTRGVGVKQRYSCNTCGRTFTVDDGFLGLKYPQEVISEAVDLYYCGLSLRIAEGFFLRHRDRKPSYGTIYTWVLRFACRVHEHLGRLRVYGSGLWCVDETVVKVSGVKHWLWVCYDHYVRVVLAFVLSADRLKRNAVRLLRLSLTRDQPAMVTTDLYHGYRLAVKRVLGNAEKHKITSLYEGGNNRLERLFGSLKDRVRVMRGFKSPVKAEVLLAGWFIHHHHVRKASNNKWLRLIQEAASFLINLTTRLIYTLNQPLI